VLYRILGDAVVTGSSQFCKHLFSSRPTAHNPLPIGQINWMRAFAVKLRLKTNRIRRAYTCNKRLQATLGIALIGRRSFIHRTQQSSTVCAKHQLHGRRGVFISHSTLSTGRRYFQDRLNCSVSAGRQEIASLLSAWSLDSKDEGFWIDS